MVSDGGVVNIDEYFSRDEFEAELRELVDEDRAMMVVRLENALQDKAVEMGSDPRDFTLREVGELNSPDGVQD